MKNSNDLRPPFSLQTALAKVQAAEDGWNSCDPKRVSLAYTEQSQWRNRSEFLQGRKQIQEFLTRKWEHEKEYRLLKSLWAFSENRIAVRFQYEYHDSKGDWYRAYGNELWQFDAEGLMERREASINEIPIKEEERQFFWPQRSPCPLTERSTLAFESFQNPSGKNNDKLS